MKRKGIVIGIIGVFLFIQPLCAHTWTVDKRLTWNIGDSIYPDTAGDSTNQIHLTWADETPGNREIYYKRYLAIGNRWITKCLTYNPGHSIHPDIAVDSNDHIHVVWGDATPGNFEILYKMSADGGTHWKTKRLTYKPDVSLSPSITIDTLDRIYVIWEDEFPGNYEIYYKRGIQ
jgi:hypothetical protein